MELTAKKFINFLLIIIIIIHSSLVYAEENNDNIIKPEKTDSEETKEGGCLAGTFALFPGIIVHGTGHFITGDADTGMDLLIIEGISFGVFIGSSAYLAYTGASRRVTGPLMPVILTSASIFIHSWFADIYGSGFGMDRSKSKRNNGKNRYFKPFIGYTDIDDVQFEYSRFYHFGIAVKYDAFYLEPRAWRSTDTENNRYLVEAAYELIGPYGIFFNDYNDIVTAGPVIRAGYHDFGDYGFQKNWIDAGITSKIELGGIWQSMRGAFVFFEWGFNREWVTFTIIDSSPVLTSNQLLFESGFGIELGKLSAPAGEVYIFYNHRRDDFTGGITGGFLGYVGIRSEVYVYKKFSLSLEYSYGSATVLNMKCSIIY